MLGLIDHVVALQRADRDELHVRDFEARGELGEVGTMRVVDLLAVIDEVHLVHAQHQMLDAQQRGDEGVAAGLFDHALARIDEDDGKVGGRGAGHHVARVLDVAGRIGDDELAPRRREVAVGHVDRDALFALGAQAVGEQREIDVPAPRCSLTRSMASS